MFLRSTLQYLYSKVAYLLRMSAYKSVQLLFNLGMLLTCSKMTPFFLGAALLLMSRKNEFRWRIFASPGGAESICFNLRLPANMFVISISRYPRLLLGTQLSFTCFHRIFYLKQQRRRIAFGYFWFDLHLHLHS